MYPTLRPLPPTPEAQMGSFYSLTSEGAENQRSFPPRLTSTALSGQRPPSVSLGLLSARSLSPSLFHHLSLCAWGQAGARKPGLAQGWLQVGTQGPSSSPLDSEMVRAQAACGWALGGQTGFSSWWGLREAMERTHVCWAPLEPGLVHTLHILINNSYTNV